MGVANNYICCRPLYRLVPVIFTPVQQFHLTCPHTFYMHLFNSVPFKNFWEIFMMSMYSSTLFQDYFCIILVYSYILYSMLFVQCTHGMIVLWNSNLIYYTAAPSTRVRNSQLDATTEQNADLDPEWHELRTTLHVVYGARRDKQMNNLGTKHTLASTIVAIVASTAHLDGLNHVILQHNKGIRWTTYQCLLDAILLARCDSWFWWAYIPLCTHIPLVHSSRYVSHCETLIQHR